MIEARNFAALREIFREWPPADVAEVILDLPEDEQVIIDIPAIVTQKLAETAQKRIAKNRQKAAWLEASASSFDPDGPVVCQRNPESGRALPPGGDGAGPFVATACIALCASQGATKAADT